MLPGILPPWEKSRCLAGSLHFFKIPKIPEIVYCAEGVFGKRTSSVRNNKIMSPWWTGGVETDGRRCLDILELEHADRNFRARVFELSSQDQTSALNAMEVVLSHPPITIALMQRPTYTMIQPGQPNPKRPKQNDDPKPLREDPI